MASLDEGSLDDCRFRDSSDESHTPPKEKGSFLLLFIVIITIFIVVIMVTQHIPTVIKSHHGGNMSVMDIGECCHGIFPPLIIIMMIGIPNSIPLVNSRFHAKVPIGYHQLQYQGDIGQICKK